MRFNRLDPDPWCISYFATRDSHHKQLRLQLADHLPQLTLLTIKGSTPMQQLTYFFDNAPSHSKVQVNALNANRMNIALGEKQCGIVLCRNLLMTVGFQEA